MCASPTQYPASRLPQRGSGAVAAGRGQNRGHSTRSAVLARAQPSSDMMGHPMLLNTVVAIVLLVLAIWGWDRATNRPRKRERDIAWC